MRIAALYVGSSLLAPLKQAERDINRQCDLDLRIGTYNLGAPLTDDEWRAIEGDLQESDIVFVIHVMDGENATRLIAALERYKQRHRAVIVINCMPELMRRTRMGRLDVSRLIRERREGGKGEKGKGERGRPTTQQAACLLVTVGSWVGQQVRGNHQNGKNHRHGNYLKLIDRLPRLLKLVPNAGRLRDVKNYLNIFCYFLQPTPVNIRSMILYSLKEYVADDRLKELDIRFSPPEQMPSLAIYHPEAPALFETFEAYRTWYTTKSPISRVELPTFGTKPLDPESTVGLLLMRPQVISKTTKHYDALIHAIEAEGLSVIPALSTFMDNREACEKFFMDPAKSNGQSHLTKSKVQSPKSKVRNANASRDEGHLTTKTGQPTNRNRHWATDNEQLTDNELRTTANSRVSQIVSLTGFSFVGGPAMNDSDAAAQFLSSLNRPYRSAVSLDTQTIESWRMSPTGLNPVQAGMQIAIPEIDGATEPFIYGGIPAGAAEPAALDERCARFARRLRRWNRLRTAPRSELKLAFVLFCFPPNKGNIGTAADLDVFPSVWETLEKLRAEGYDVRLPSSPDALRNELIGGNAERFGASANVAHRMDVSEYRRLCPFVEQVEEEWGAAPGRINSSGGELLIQGVHLGKAFIGVQPTFGYEGDPMRLMMAQGGAPHHGFMAFYTYLSQVLNVDAVVHVGTHGAMEFMPGKQVGLSGECWPDRLIGEMPNLYLYSVNNPSEGSIAKRRSYAELISYLTPPIENAGLYKDLGSLKDLITDYREAREESERERLFESIQAYAGQLNLN